MRIRLQLGALATAVVVAALAPIAPAHAKGGPPPATPDTHPLTYTTTVTVDSFTAKGKKLGHVVYPATTATSGEGGGEEVVPSTDGTVSPAVVSGGTSSATGCKNLSVMHVGKTYLGFTAYQFINTTHWCWTRSTQTVYSVNTTYQIANVDSEYKWDGIIDGGYIHGFYDYSTNDGHPYSAYKNQRTGHFEDCVLKYGCVGNIYPTVLIRSYYNGTYAWDTWT